MTELLRQVVAHVEQLPPEQQVALAEAFWREIEEREWEGLLATPESQRFLKRLALETLQEEEAGRTQPSGNRW
ncbi:MAG TPA: hypothetical protein VGR16_13840 [Thermomicrobiales bacterium]|nr:hypothetical protein [Thermomicrobiales bacterium]